VSHEKSHFRTRRSLKSAVVSFIMLIACLKMWVWQLSRKEYEQIH
jgi:cytochrome oxidase assembly protein ShyY1